MNSPPHSLLAKPAHDEIVRSRQESDTYRTITNKVLLSALSFYSAEMSIIEMKVTIRVCRALAQNEPRMCGTRAV